MSTEQDSALESLRALGVSVSSTLERVRRWRARAGEIGVRLMDELVSRMAGRPVRTRSKDILKRAAQLAARIPRDPSELGAVMQSVMAHASTTESEAPRGSSAAPPAPAPEEPDRPTPPWSSVASTPSGAPPTGPEAPESGVLLLPRDPEWGYVSWKLSYDRIGRAAAGMSQAEARLRVFGSAGASVDEAVMPSRGRYFFAWPGGADETYTAELIIRGVDGHEVCLAQSKPVCPSGAALAPPAAPASSVPLEDLGPFRAPETALKWLTEATNGTKTTGSVVFTSGTPGEVLGAEVASAGRTRASPSSWEGASWGTAGEGGARRGASYFGFGSASRAAASRGAPSSGAVWGASASRGSLPASAGAAPASRGVAGPTSWAPASRGAAYGPATSTSGSRARSGAWPAAPDAESDARFRGPRPGPISEDVLGFGLGERKGALVPVTWQPDVGE